MTVRLPSERLTQLLGQANILPKDILPLAQATLLMPVLEPFEIEDNEDDVELDIGEDLTYEQIFESDYDSNSSVNDDANNNVDADLKSQ